MKVERNILSGLIHRCIDDLEFAPVLVSVLRENADQTRICLDDDMVFRMFEEAIHDAGDDADGSSAFDDREISGKMFAYESAFFVFVRSPEKSALEFPGDARIVERKSQSIKLPGISEKFNAVSDEVLPPPGFRAAQAVGDFFHDAPKQLQRSFTQEVRPRMRSRFRMRASIAGTVEKSAL